MLSIIDSANLDRSPSPAAPPTGTAGGAGIACNPEPASTPNTSGVNVSPSPPQPTGAAATTSHPVSRIRRQTRVAPRNLFAFDFLDMPITGQIKVDFLFRPFHRPTTNRG
jgi:hypothetical protein